MNEQKAILVVSETYNSFERVRPTLNSCVLSHWLPTSTNDINSTLLACLYARFYALFSGINAASFPVLIRRFNSSTSGVKTYQLGLSINEEVMGAARSAPHRAP